MLFQRNWKCESGERDSYFLDNLLNNGIIGCKYYTIKNRSDFKGALDVLSCHKYAMVEIGKHLIKHFVWNQSL